MGMIPASYPKTFYRVETWSGGHYVADFTTAGEAYSYAIAHDKERGCRFDHRVAQMHLTGE